MKNKNLYEILGLNSNATKQEIKIAYRKLVRVYHPDVNKTPEAEKYFKMLNNAVETLLDDAKRLQYDVMTGIYQNLKQDVQKQKNNKQGEDDFFTKKNSQKQAETFARKAKEPNKTSKTFDFNKFYKNENLKNAYSSLSDNEETGKTGYRQAKIDGKDIETLVVISETEAKRGTVRKVNVLHTDKCPKCLGRKYINGSICALCKGAGEKSEHKKMNVKIPQGIKSGVKIKIKNEGEYGKFGGKNGDLYLLIEIKKETAQKFEGNKIITEVPISPWQAVLGGKIKVPFEGGEKEISIPPLTKSMTRFKLNKEGQKTSFAALKAEYIVVLRIDIPDEITEDERKLYEKLKDIAENH